MRNEAENELLEDVPIGFLAKEFGGKSLPLTVLKSGAGFYLGTTTEEGYPFTRESREYWAARHEADVALKRGDWTQRPAL